MPYQVKKIGKTYQLYNLEKKTFVNMKFRSKKAAISAGKNFMRYRNEVPVVKGDKILPKN